MKVVVADTNIFLRFLTKDVLKQAEKVKRIFYEGQKGKIKIIVFPITIVEILFHLENWYRFSKIDAVEKLIIIFSPSWIKIEEKEVLFEALETYKKNSVDFVDIFTWSLAKELNLSILSFDKDYDKLTPKLRLEP